MDKKNKTIQSCGFSRAAELSCFYFYFYLIFSGVE